MLLVNLSVGRASADLYHGLIGTVTVLPDNSDGPIKTLFEEGVGEIDIYPYEFEVTDGVNTVYRRQYPLMLAWALTIHKCQGMQVAQAKIDCESAWEAGQVYTAISRLIAFDGLFLSGFAKGKVKANSEAVRFYQQLSKESKTA